MKHNRATDRMARLIAAIPWIVARDGVLVDEVAERFDYPRDLLLDDLENVVFFVGVPPYTPDTLIEVHIDDDMVWIRYADWFSRPMRLSPAESLALLAAGETALAFDTDDAAGPLARGLAKLRLATGANAEVLDIQIGSPNQEILNVVRDAQGADRCVEIAYYSFGRDTRTDRTIEPQRIFLDAGHWYVAGLCHLAQAQRIFRVDRIERAIRSDQPMSQAIDDAEASFDLDASPRVTVRVPTDRLRVLDGVAVDEMEQDETATMAQVTFPVSSHRWLDQLLLRLGPEATLVSKHGDIDDNSSKTASAILARYVSAASDAHSLETGR